MNSLPLILVTSVLFGALGLSGCSSCSQQNSTPPPLPVTCGPGTVAQGTQCVGEVQKL